MATINEYNRTNLQLNRLNQILGIVVLTIILVGCGKSKAKINKGTYHGTFTATYFADTIPYPRVQGSASVIFEKKTYNSLGTTAYNPAGGSGSYSIADDIISFEDENIWTANFDWGLILNGEYNYTKLDDKLILVRESTIARYEYSLTIQ